MPTVLDLVQLAAAVYDDRHAPGRWSRIATPGGRLFEIAGSLAGLDAALFSRGGETVLAFRGTEQASVADWTADLQHHVGGTSRQLGGAARTAIETIKAHGRIWMTGHSLGGFLAGHLASYLGQGAVVFNAHDRASTGLTGLTICGAAILESLFGSAAGIGCGRGLGRVHAIEAEGDFVPMLGDEPAWITTRIGVSLASCATFEAVCRHSLDRLAEAIAADPMLAARSAP